MIIQDIKLTLCLEILKHKRKLESSNLEHKGQICIMYILYHKRLLISRDTNQIWNTFLLKSYYTHAPTHRIIHSPYTLHSFFKVNGYSFGLTFLITLQVISYDIELQEISEQVSCYITIILWICNVRNQFLMVILCHEIITSRMRNPSPMKGPYNKEQVLIIHFHSQMA